MGLTNRIKSMFSNKYSSVKMVTERGNGFYAWNGKIYHSDIVRAAISPKVKAVGKLVGKHIRETVTKDMKTQTVVNPDAYMRFLLEEPNPYMSGQKLQEKLASQLAINKNAFALIIRDDNGWPVEIYPIPCSTVESTYSESGELFLKFYYHNGKSGTFRYSDIIHLRECFHDNDLFGESLAGAITPLMEIINVIDQGLIKTIKNSSVIRWLLKFNSSMRPEDIEKNTQRFVDSFMDIDNGSGVAGVDQKAEAVQIHPDEYVPNAAQMDRITERIYALINTNEKIVTSSYSEDEWNSYFDAEIEPILIDMRSEYTRKLFSRRERGCGNRIVFEASSWDNASLKTKLNLLQMVDRGALTPNEWRNAFNLAPLPGGDEAVRRLDTATVKNGVKEGGEEK